MQASKISLSLKYAFGKVAGIAMFCFIYSTSVAQEHNFDYNTLREIQESRNTSQDNFFITISKINNPVSLAGPATLFIIGLAKHDNDLKKKALYVTESIAVSTIITFSLKNIVKRPRPYLHDSTFVPVVFAKGKSFPSGHTSEAFSMATAMSLACPKWYVIVPAYSWAGMMAYARMYLGVHYPTDVIAGAVVGAGSAWLTFKANQWISKKKKTKNLTTFLY